MRLQGLLQPLIENEKFIDISMGLKTKTFPINIVGLSESGKSYIIAENWHLQVLQRSAEMSHWQRQRN